MPMKRIKRETPLAVWLREAQPEERERMARLAGTSINYLHQIAACRREPKVRLALSIAQATSEMKRRGLAPIKVEQLATMCAVEGL
jgi:DNA-binding transcriptional regulator YdaS (Cro superfamily)